MQVNKLRLARVGEVPHFIASEDIIAGQAVVDMELRSLENEASMNARAVEESILSRRVRIGVDMAKPGAERTVFVVRETAKQSTWSLVWPFIVVLLLAALVLVIGAQVVIQAGL